MADVNPTIVYLLEFIYQVQITYTCIQLNFHLPLHGYIYLQSQDMLSAQQNSKNILVVEVNTPFYIYIYVNPLSVKLIY